MEMNFRRAQRASRAPIAAALCKSLIVDKLIAFSPGDTPAWLDAKPVVPVTPAAKMALAPTSSGVQRVRGSDVRSVAGGDVGLRDERG